MAIYSSRRYMGFVSIISSAEFELRDYVFSPLFSFSSHPHLRARHVAFLPPSRHSVTGRFLSSVNYVRPSEPVHQTSAHVRSECTGAYYSINLHIYCAFKYEIAFRLRCERVNSYSARQSVLSVIKRCGSPHFDVSAPLTRKGGPDQVDDLHCQSRVERRYR